MPKLRNGSKGDSNPGFLDCESELHDKFLLSFGKVEVLDLFIHCSSRCDEKCRRLEDSGIVRENVKNPIEGTTGQFV